jgi:hypothetical protein
MVMWSSARDGPLDQRFDRVSGERGAVAVLEGARAQARFVGKGAVGQDILGCRSNLRNRRVAGKGYSHPPPVEHLGDWGLVPAPGRDSHHGKTVLQGPHRRPVTTMAHEYRGAVHQHIVIGERNDVGQHKT